MTTMMIKAPQKNWLEWSVFAVGLALLLAIVGYLGYRAISDGRDPAALHVEVGAPWSPEDAPAVHVVSVTVRNDGGQSAAEVDVEVILPGDPPERSELTFDHVPHGSSRSGALTFERRPEPGQLRVRVLGYLEP